MLQQHGYATSWFGKNHNTPPWEINPAGPFTRWPTGLGFDHFYGFTGGETNLVNGVNLLAIQVFNFGASDADALLVRSATQVDAEVLAAGRRLRVVARAGPRRR